jgi:SAM-dependent methyltransferase
MTKDSQKFYGQDLAYIHDAGFGGVARQAAEFLKAALATKVLKHAANLRSLNPEAPKRLVVDLGCGSGVLSAAMAEAGYDVWGVDFSAEMVALARTKAPAGEFHQESILDVDPPTCIAATLVGEVVNYLFDAKSTDSRLSKLFQRIQRALAPGGVLLLDAAGPGRVPGGKRRSFTEGDGWVCLVDVEEDAPRRLLTRRITTFRQSTDCWRRSDEVHRQRLYRPAELARLLRSAGFRVQRLAGYVDRFPPGVAGFLAKKSAR